MATSQAPIDEDSLEEARWARFVQDLSTHLAGQWPAMPERLGERYAAFVEHGVQQALRRGIVRAAAVARYVNLWFVWGAVFHDKPGFEWAQGLLAAPREQQWGTVHQLVQRSVRELERLPESRISAADLAAADRRLVDRFGALGSRGALQPPEPPPVPLQACDLEAIEIQLHTPAATEHYALDAAGAWRRESTPLPPPLRVDAARPLPRVVAVLSRPPGEAPAARLQLRARSHRVCDGGHHPTLRFLGSHGLWQWQGHETRAVSWSVRSSLPPLPAGGAGSAIAEETSPAYAKLELLSCGLRDEGDAIGSPSTLVWIWPAAQWWLELQRSAPAAQAIQPGTTPVRGTTRCRLECDGTPAEPAGVQRGFDDGLEPATASALQTLLAAWTRVPALSAPSLHGSLALLVGRCAATWGWRLGAGGLDGQAFMRLVAELDMQACQADLHFEGEISVGGARGRVLLRCVEQAPLRQSLRREATEPALLPVCLPALARFRLPLQADILPLADDSAALLQVVGPCAGALVGEAGWRPRTSGGSGWEWFASLRLEAVSLPVAVVDPLLGSTQRTLTLLDALPLLDWRLG